MVALFVPLDGRITSQNVLAAPLDGSAVMEIVSPGNAEAGNTYQVTLAILAGFFAAYPASSAAIVTEGATLDSPYPVSVGGTRVLFNKIVGAASAALLPPASLMQYPGGVLFKDLKGDASTNPITILFSSGELCDNLAQLQITSDYGWLTVVPVPDNSGAWYQA